MYKRKARSLDKKVHARYTYAWNWFSYHASQRLIAFRYFLLIIGAISLGYFKCLEMKLFWYSVFICFFGMMVCVAFFLLEIRNEELVNCGRHALDRLEEEMGLEIRKDDVDRRHLRESLQGTFYFRKKQNSKKSEELEKPEKIPKLIKDITKHKFWLRVIYLLAFLAFFALLVERIIKVLN